MEDISQSIPPPFDLDSEKVKVVFPSPQESSVIKICNSETGKCLTGRSEILLGCKLSTIN